MAYLPTVEFGPGMTSATEVRGAWPQLNEKRKTALVMSLYPKTQTNPKLAATVVKLLDTAMGTELKEFAPGNGGGESGRWYTDDQMTDIVGDGWYNDLDVSGDIPKQQMIQQAQDWLDDQGYSVQVLNCKVNDDNMEWYIEGSFHNPGFAKKGVTEKLGDHRPKLGSKRDAGKSVRKWRSERGLDEVDAQNFVGGMTAGYQRRENQPVSEGPFVQRIMHPGRVSIYVRSGKVPKLVATDIPYEILDRYIAKVIAKYPQFKPSDFSFESSDKVSENQGWAATYEGLKPDAFAALQQAKQNIEQNRQQEVDQWEQDFRANSAKLAGQQLKQRFNPPAVPVAQPGEKHSVLKNRIAQLDQAIKKQQQLDALSQKLEYKGLLTPAMQQDFDTRLLVRGAAADNYRALNLKLDRAIEIATNRLRTNKLAFKENADYIDEANKQ
jgi:hypothetical protein